jgi:hypothetical protein
MFQCNQNYSSFVYTVLCLCVCVCALSITDDAKINYWKGTVNSVKFIKKVQWSEV